MTHSKEENRCKHCDRDIAIRNPIGFCDHLYYPENCDVCAFAADIAPLNPTETKDPISEIVAEFEEQWRGAHKVRGNDGKEALYSLNYGINKLSPYLRSALLKYREHVLEEVCRKEAIKWGADEMRRCETFHFNCCLAEGRASQKAEIVALAEGMKKVIDHKHDTPKHKKNRKSRTEHYNAALSELITRLTTKE